MEDVIADLVVCQQDDVFIKAITVQAILQLYYAQKIQTLQYIAVSLMVELKKAEAAIVLKIQQITIIRLQLLLTIIHEENH